MRGILEEGIELAQELLCLCRREREAMLEDHLPLLEEAAARKRRLVFRLAEIAQEVPPQGMALEGGGLKDMFLGILLELKDLNRDNLLLARKSLAYGGKINSLIKKHLDSYTQDQLV